MSAAFVSAPLFNTAFAGKAVVASSPVRAVRAQRTNVITMIKSKSMPFMEAPPALDGTAAGDVGFDPLGFSRVIDFRFLQEAEIKHCRLCMLAALGFIVQELYQFPGVPKMLATDAHDVLMKVGTMSQLSLWVHFAEIVSLIAVIETLNGKRAPGDFKFDPLGFAKDEATMKKMQVSELKNGRLAMIAVGGFIHQMWITKQGVIEQLTHFKPLPFPH